MKFSTAFSASLCVSVLTLAAVALTSSGKVAIAGGDPPICSQGFHKGSMSGTPTNTGSSFVCTTEVITCPAPSGIGGPATAVMEDQKAEDVTSNHAKFSYKCVYEGSPP